MRPQSKRKSGFDLNPALLGLVLFGPLFCTTVLAKLGVPFGPREVPASLYMILAIMIIGLATSKLVFDMKRLAFFLLAVGFMGGVQVYRGIGWSPTSFFMMVGLYATYTMSLSDPNFDVRRAVRVFLNVCTVIAILGIAQFFLQFVIGPTLAFPVDYMLPKSLLVEGYMNLNVLHYGSSTIKANGVFLLEASFFSQLLAIAVITELVSANRVWRLAIYLAGMVVSYSGTGIIVLLVTMPFLIITKRRVDLMLVALFGLVMAIILYEPLNLKIFVDRATEFGAVKSSGFMRFTGAYYFFEQFLWQDQWGALFGYGAGNFMSYADRANLPVHESALTKIIFEFGIIGGLVNLGFLFFCVARSTAPAMIKVGCAVMFFMAGIYTPSSHGIALTLLMWPSPIAVPIEQVKRSAAIFRWLGLGQRNAHRGVRAQQDNGAGPQQRPKRRPARAKPASSRQKPAFSSD